MTADGEGGKILGAGLGACFAAHSLGFHLALWYAFGVFPPFRGTDSVS
jgi:hypothetical protein